MRPKAAEGRMKKVTVRFTEKEYEQLKTQMKNSDYISMSRFLRDKVLNKRVKIKRDIEYTDRDFRNQINSLSSVVAKIGVDYNQATKKFNTLCKKTKPDGTPVINARAANYYLKQIAQMTAELKETMDKIIELVIQLGQKEPLYGESINQ